EQKTGTNAYLTKENNTESELHAKIENIDANSIRDKDRNREETSPMPEINLSPSSGTIEPNSSVTCILNFIPGDSLGIYNYELQLLSNDPVSPLVTVPLEYVVTSPIAYIPDDNFRMAINEALGQPAEYQPTIADLNGLTGTLSAYQRNIISIEGAQYLTNLQDLHLQNNQISDLSPLAGLTHLLWLDLDDNQISDISPLAGLTNLQDLWLSHNQISDLSPLAGLTNLHYLNLDNNQISDLSPLAELSNLQGLNLWSNQISNLSPLASMTNLNYLILEYNQISDLSPLAGLTYLQNLDLGLNLISDLSTLAGLNNLKDLYLYNNQISDLRPLAGLSNLQYLRLNYNQISDLSPLVGLTNLQGLDLSYNQISDLSPLLGLTHLANLWLDGNPISYESMLLSQSWTLPWSTNEYNPLSPCYPVPSRNATNVLVNYPLSWQGNYDHSQDVFYEVWLGISPDSLFSQGLETQMVNVTEHLYSFTPMLEPLTQYYWRIRAIAPTDTIWSGIWSFTTGEEFYQPIISVTPTNIYAELTTAETSQRQITIANQGTAPLIWNSNIVLTRAEQKTGT
ncbi:MAG TPA: leucine-rich repeat domain-containing protein, partial [Candidatus Syntrophosphaera thermopropionivorans]|nr:leucine-rich repeat domain-containing protein [Candidatus Syntrophosphaera thermopropionivorans]